MSESIKLEIINGVAQIRLNRPKALNSFNKEMTLRLQEILEEVDLNKEIRAVMITGEGKAFSAGQDLKEVMDKDKNPGFEKILEEGYNPIIRLIRSIKKPFLAAVNGVAAGAGANIALACDIVVASEEASFIQAFSKIGLVPDSGGTYFLPRLIGFQKAAALMMLGDKVGAEEAERIGMIYKFFSKEEFAEKTTELAERLAKMPTKALGLTKELLNQSQNISLDAQLDMESNYQIKSAKSADHQEGITAFMERRKPEFRGE